MTDIEPKSAESATGNAAFIRLKSNSVPATIFMTSFSDFP